MSEVTIDSSVLQQMIANAIAAALTGQQPAAAALPTMEQDAARVASVLGAEHTSLLRKFFAAHVGREHTYRDCMIALGLRDEAPEPTARPARAARPTVDWSDPVAVRVNASGHPINKAGAFIAWDRVQDPNGVVRAWIASR